MNKYDLIAKVAKYATVITTVYCLGKFGLNIYFDKNLLERN